MKIKRFMFLACVLAAIAVPSVLAQDKPGLVDCPPCPCQCPTPVPEGTQPYTVAINRIEDPAQPGTLYDPVPDKKLIAVEVIIANIIGEPVDINPLNATLVDVDGFSYRPELGAYAGGQIDMVTLNLGEKVAGWIAFEIPPTAKTSYIKYDISGYPKVTVQSAKVNDAE